MKKIAYPAIGLLLTLPLSLPAYALDLPDLPRLRLGMREPSQQAMGGRARLPMRWGRDAVSVLQRER